MKKSKRTDPPPRIEGYVDTHFHALQMSERGVDVPQVLDQARAFGLAAAVEIGVHPEELERRRAMLPDVPWLFLTSGIGPAASAGAWEPLPSVLERQLEAGDLAAVGEIGLDWYRDYAPREVQIDLFRRQLALATDYDLPVVIHNREADRETADALEAVSPPRRGVMHCFSSDTAAMRRFVELGYYISFAGNVTFRSACDIREAARTVQSDRLLIETDSPYLTPVPVRGGTNTPLYCPFTYAFIAELRGVPVETLAAQVRANAEELFGLTRRG